jgi:DNA-binding NarL/FixJ family response regulator
VADRTRIFIADDHPLIRAGLRHRLETEPDLVVVAEAANGREVQRWCPEVEFDVLVLDLNMPGPTALETVDFVRRCKPESRVLILTAFEEDTYVRLLIDVGVAGYVLKDEVPDALVHAIRSVAHGARWFSQPIVVALTEQSARLLPSGAKLTRREQQVLALLGEGLDNQEIAKQLSLSPQTVRNYISRLYDKLGVHTRAEAIVWTRNHRHRL